MSIAAPLQTARVKVQAPNDSARARRRLQRSCACATRSAGFGGCARCAPAAHSPKNRLVIGPRDDAMEREADRIAAAVMAGASATGTRDASRAAPNIQRAPASDAGARDAAVPAFVDAVLQGPGQPLDSSARTFLERGFGHDFGRVRIHADARAAASARAVGARAYTVGHDVVFGAGEYRPGTEDGRRLLAHELTHTVQQGGGRLRLQRMCVSSVCPPVLLPIDALFPRWEAAEKCIQGMYASSHPAKPGISLSFNADWLHLTGGSANEKAALACLRGEETPGAGPNFTAKGSMVAAAPDIWDFANTTMYEITTPSGAQFRIAKLGAQIELANSLCGPAECGGLQFDRGGWKPPSGCFALGGDLYFTMTNVQGVIVYNLFKDAAKELALATALAAVAAALKLTGGTAAKAVAGAAGKKLIPAYAVASLAAMAVLLASGRAEAKLGPGDEEPLAQLLEALEKKGTKVPPEIQEMIDANPELKEKMNQALAEGGDPTALQDEINKQILDTIAANKDKFTAEELELLLATTRVAGKALPKADMTAEALKRLAAAVKAGKTGGEGEGTGEGDGGATPAAPDQPATESTKDPAADQDAAKKSDPPIKPETRAELGKAAAPVRDLLTGLLGTGPTARKLNDAQLKRFLSMLPAGLSAEQVAKLLEKRKGAEGETADAMLDSLQAALKELDAPAGAKPDSGTESSPGDGAAPGPATPSPAKEAPAPDATLTIGPTVSGTKKTTPAELIKQLAAKARASKFGDIEPGQYRVTWKPEEAGKPGVGSFISGSLRGKLKDGTRYVGRIEAVVTGVDGSQLKIRFETATPMVSAAGVVVFKADHFIGREDAVVLDPPKKRKVRK